MNESKKIARALATRILNLAMPYIPDNISKECMEIINNETRELVTIKDDTKHNFAHTIIRKKDSGELMEAIISIKTAFPLNGDNDDKFLFYCESMEEFEHLKDEDNDQNFIIVGCVLFTETL